MIQKYAVIEIEKKKHMKANQSLKTLGEELKHHYRAKIVRYSETCL